MIYVPDYISGTALSLALAPLRLALGVLQTVESRPTSHHLDISYRVYAPAAVADDREPE